APFTRHCPLDPASEPGPTVLLTLLWLAKSCPIHSSKMELNNLSARDDRRSDTIIESRAGSHKPGSGRSHRDSRLPRARLLVFQSRPQADSLNRQESAQVWRCGLYVQVSQGDRTLATGQRHTPLRRDLP